MTNPNITLECQPSPTSLQRPRIGDTLMSDGRALADPVRSVPEAVGRRVFRYNEFYEPCLGYRDLVQLHKDRLDAAGRRSLAWVGALLRRSFDAVVSLLVPILPITLLTALAVRLAILRPTVYRQERWSDMGGSSC